MEKLVPVYYVGRNREKIDNVLNTHRIWPGRGSMLEVPQSDANVYVIRHPDVWSFNPPADDVPEVVIVQAPTDPDINHVGPEPAKLGTTANPAPRKTDAQPIPEIDPEARDELLEAAILALDPANTDDDYTKQGVPRVAKVSEIMEGPVTADEIDKAFQRLKLAGKIRFPTDE